MTEQEEQQSEITYKPYTSEEELRRIMVMMQEELSEPYSIFTYRYFLNTWAHISLVAYDGDQIIGAIINKVDMHKVSRGYIAMLVVSRSHRRKGIGKELVKRAIDLMIEDGAEEIVLETEGINKAALSLYESLGFVRDKRIHAYYLNGEDAFRLKLWTK